MIIFIIGRIEVQENHSGLYKNVLKQNNYCVKACHFDTLFSEEGSLVPESASAAWLQAT